MRREARRQGLALSKSRIDGTYGLLDPVLNAWVIAPMQANGTSGASLEVVMDWLRR